MDKESLNVSSIDVLWPEGYFDLLARLSPGLLLLFSLMLIEWPGKLGEVIGSIAKKDTSIAYQVVLVAGMIAMAWCLGFVCASLGTRIERRLVRKCWQEEYVRFHNLNSQASWQSQSGFLGFEVLKHAEADGLLHEWLKVHVPQKDRFLVKKAAESRLPCAMMAALILVLVYHPASWIAEKVWGSSPNLPKHDWLMFGIACVAFVLVIPVARREVAARIRRQFDMLAARGSVSLLK